MRVVVLAALVALSSGCMFEGAPCKIDPAPWKTCSYGLAMVTASVRFDDAAWDKATALGAFEALGFAPSTSSPDVAATEAKDGLRMRATEGVVLDLEVSPQGERAGLGYTQAQAEDAGRAMEEENRARVEALVSGFERETGWTRSGDLAWHAQLMVI